jgi:hypothetical protein
MLTVAPNLGEALSLKGGSSNHVYLGFYARSANQNARSGLIGYDAAGSDVLNIVNERPGGLVAVNGTILPIERGIVNFNSDWNSYTTPGYYQVNDGGSSAANTPPATYLYGLLSVIKAGTAITQLYTQHVGSGTFVRQAYDGGWGPWVELSPNFENRFVVQKYVDSVTVIANGSQVIASAITSIPSGKALYLRRARWDLNAPLLPRIYVGPNAWSGSSSSNDAAMDVFLSNSSPAYIGLQLVNPSSSNVSAGGRGIWAEFEIR